MMKKLIYSLTIVFYVATLLSCKKYTDILPKGKNLLNKASDLDMLLNYNYFGETFLNQPQSILVNDMYGIFSNVPNTIAGPLNMNKVILTYDEKSDRAALTTTDNVYSGMYQIISRIANIALTNAETASGDQALLKQVKAEAYIIRAYMHYMLVNNYAKAYDPATAATDGGIPYVNSIDFETPNAKNTVKEVYDKMIADVDAALALNALPDQPKNSMRIGKGFAYAVKAEILLSMRDYAGALAAANSSLTFNSTLEDHRPYLTMPKATTMASRIGLTAPDNLLYAYQGKLWPTYFGVSKEIMDSWFEPGNIIKDWTATYNLAYGTSFNGVPGSAVWASTAYEQNAAGLTTSDMFFVKAESLIRTGKIAEGIDVVNQVRLLRIAPYTPLVATTEAQAMLYLQRASRIEFLFTWRNFINIKRWNRENKYPVVVERTVNNVKYTLSPTSPLWVFPFPQNATAYNPTLTQNY